MATQVKKLSLRKQLWTWEMLEFPPFSQMLITQHDLASFSTNFSKSVRLQLVHNVFPFHINPGLHILNMKHCFAQF